MAKRQRDISESEAQRARALSAAMRECFDAPAPPEHTDCVDDIDDVDPFAPITVTDDEIREYRRQLKTLAVQFGMPDLAKHSAMSDDQIREAITQTKLYELAAAGAPLPPDPYEERDIQECLDAAFPEDAKRRQSKGRKP